MSDLGSRQFRFGVLCTLLVASFLVALPSLGGGLLTYDDTNLIVGEPGGDDAALQRGAMSYLSRPYYYAYLPVYGLSYWADTKLGANGERPFLFRFGNMLWHAAAGFAAFAVLARLTRNRVAALFGALVFVVHPLHVESVAWISGRKEVVSGFFFFLAWLFWLAGEDDRPGMRAAAAAAMVVACFAKASAVVLPGVIIASMLLLPRYAGRRRAAVLSTWPLLAVVAVPVVVHMVVGVRAGVVAGTASFPTRIAALAAGWGGTIQRALVPWGLSIDYPEAIETGRAWIPALWLLAAIAALVAWRRRVPTVAAGVLIFLVALTPFNNVYPWTGTVVVDRYAYLSVFGLALAIAWFAERSHEWRMGLAVAVAVLLGLSMRSAARFASDEALWTATLRDRPESGLAFVQRGVARLNAAMKEKPHPKDRLEAASSDLSRGAVRTHVRESKIKAHRALISARMLLGDGDGALDAAAKALELLGEPDKPERRRFKASVLMARAEVYRNATRKDGPRVREFALAAAGDFLAAARIAPTYEAWFNAGTMLKRARQPDAALKAFVRAGRLDGAKPDPHVQMAELHRQLGDRKARKHALDEASRRAHDNPFVVEAWVWYWLDKKSPDFERAGRELLRLDQKTVLARRLGAEVAARRALFYFRRGNLKRALHAADVARLQGSATPRAFYDLGQIYLEAGRFEDAVACYRSAEDALESRAVYRNAIARAYALKAYRHLVADEHGEARTAMQSALAVRPDLIDAGAAPLRGEIERLAQAVKREPGLLMVGIAAVAGDPERGEEWVKRVRGGDLEPADLALLHHLRALFLGFTPPFRFAEAEEDLRSALDLLPKDRWARYRLAQIWVRAGVDWTRVGQQVDSDERKKQGRAYLQRAIKLLTELITEEPDFHLARLQRGEAYFALGDELGAKADYEGLRHRGAGLRESALKEAVLHRYNYVRGGEASNLTIALRLLDQALQLDPHYFDALFEMGNVYHLLYDRQKDGSEERRRAFTQAILAYRRAMALNPRQTEPRTEWARICLKAARAAAALNEIKPAHELLKRIAEEVDDTPGLFKERIRLNMRPEFYAETRIEPAVFFPAARRALDRLEEIAPHDPELPEVRSLFYRRLGWSHYLQWAKLEQVVKMLAVEAQGEKVKPAEGAVERTEDPPETPAERAERVAKLNKRREVVRKRAVEAWVQALRSWPDDPENDAVRRRLRELAPEIVVFDEKQAKQALARGRAAFARRDFETAAVEFREALLLFPSSTAIRFNYAAALLECRRFNEAREPLISVATSREAAEYPEAYYELGRLYDRESEFEIAKQWYHRFVASRVAAGREDDPRVEAARERLAAFRDD